MKTINKNFNLSVLLFAFSLLLFSSCGKDTIIGCLSPKGSTETRTFSFDDFDRVSIEVNSEVSIEEGDEFFVEIKSTKNILDRIEDKSSVSGNDLRIRVNKCTNNIDPEDVKITIIMPEFHGLDYSGNGIVSSVNTMQVASDIDLRMTGNAEFDFDFNDLDDLHIEMTGNGSIKTDMESANLVDLDITGNGDIRMSGTTVDQIIENNGNADIFNFDLLSQVTRIDFTGNGDAEVFASEELDVNLTGNGNVCFKGDPATLNTSVTGNGTLSSCD